ncbi:MAG: 4Fe-4S binding protein [Gammaproteobacteria bacterium]|nr:4Fe-4S binding protein [Gammaproteobacteria bacterium]
MSRFIAGAEPATLYPEADRIEAVPGDLPVARALRGDELLGHLFLTTDHVGTIGYSGKPIHVVVGLDDDAVIRSVELVEHSEPIVLIGIPEARIRKVIEGYVGFDVAAYARDIEREQHQVDIVSGATVTIMVIDDTVLRASVKVARALRLGGLEPAAPKDAGPRAVLDTSRPFASADWEELLEMGAVRALRLTVDDVNRAFASSGHVEAAARPEPGPPDDVFIDLYAGLASVPWIGRNLLGDREFANLEATLAPGQHAVAIAGLGRYSFKGSGYVRGGIFDRIQLQQGDNVFRFHDYHHKRLRRIAAEGAPGFTDVDLFRIPEEVPFDPAAPWRLELLVGRDVGPTSKAFQTFDLRYQLPESFVRYETPAADEAPAASAETLLWQKIWRSKQVDIAILVVALGFLTLVFFFQEWLTKRPVLTERVRVGFLLFTLFWLGLYANAQLSVVNVMTVFNALVTGFSWDYFLMEPLIFILWGGVAASLLFWGRGVFCGWLCPFGAMQELLNRLARRLRIPQWTVPWGLHERLWTVKYIVFLGLFGVSLHSLALAEQLAEVEPFKTAIILKFVREWPFVLFAVATLAVGLFVERAYCRYLCPLGAALAIPGRLRMFEWLKRYNDCGTRCQICANGCMVQSIHPEGQINPNECLYCLHCQELYHDDRRCPVMVKKRQRRERKAELSARMAAGVEKRQAASQAHHAATPSEQGGAP